MVQTKLYVNGKEVSNTNNVTTNGSISHTTGGLPASNLYMWHNNLWPLDTANKLLERVSDAMMMPYTGGFPKWESYSDEDGSVHLVMALAGYKKEQLSVVVNGKTLTVSATKDEEDDNNGFNRVIARRAFTKDFTVGENLSLENCTVEYKDGLLHVVLPPVTEKLKKVLEIK